jgi:hypothetical protein
MGKLGYMALEEYDPGAALPGVIGRATDESSPAWPTGRRCLRRVPGVGTRWMRGYGRWVREILVVADGGARIEVAASADGCERACGPFAVGGPVR